MIPGGVNFQIQYTSYHLCKGIPEWKIKKVLSQVNNITYNWIEGKGNTHFKNIKKNESVSHKCLWCEVLCPFLKNNHINNFDWIRWLLFNTDGKHRNMVNETDLKQNYILCLLMGRKTDLQVIKMCLDVIFTLGMSTLWSLPRCFKLTCAYTADNFLFPTLTLPLKICPYFPLALPVVHLSTLSWQIQD